MSSYLVKESRWEGEVVVPSSKSETLRAILFGALADGKSVIHSYLPSPDSQAMVEACRLFGSSVDIYPHKIEMEGLKGKIQQVEDVIHAGNSGIVLRFCAAIGALSSYPIVLTGDYSIRHQRTMKPLLDGLSQLGVSATSMRNDGYAPVIIQGPLHPGRAYVDGADSQPISALLIASSFANGTTDLFVSNPGEKPWVSLTLNWLQRLGVFYENQDFQQYRLKGSAHYEGFEYTVPGDWSSAAFPIAAALVTHSELIVHNIDMKEIQGDKEVVRVFQQMGACIEIEEDKKRLYVKKGGSLSGVSVDINNFVDALPILAVVACFAEGETHLYNAAVTRHKECNRIHAVATELQKMGGYVMETDDGLSIRKSFLKGTSVHSHHDHRMAMSLAVAGLGAEGETHVSDVDCVAKTYPSFQKDFNTFGAHIEVSL